MKGARFPFSFISENKSKDNLNLRTICYCVAKETSAQTLSWSLIFLAEFLKLKWGVFSWMLATKNVYSAGKV